MLNSHLFTHLAEMEQDLDRAAGYLSKAHARVSKFLDKFDESQQFRSCKMKESLDLVEVARDILSGTTLYLKYCDKKLMPVK